MFGLSLYNVPLGYPNANVSQEMVKCSNKWIVQITEAHTFIYKTLLNYSNRTYTCAQNTLIEQSFQYQLHKGTKKLGLDN